MYMMNYLFDFNRDTGLFSGDRTASTKKLAGLPNELYTSKNWLKFKPTATVPKPGSPFPAIFNPETLTWEDLEDMDSGTLLIPKSTGADDGNVGIRIALDPDSSSAPIPLGAAGAQLTVVVCFGKPVQGTQKRASPFEDGGAAVKTTYVFANQPSNQQYLGNPISWFFALDLVKFRPPVGKKNRTHRYEFAVGVTVTSGGITHHYSHDPEMDITT